MFGALREIRRPLPTLLVAIPIVAGLSAWSDGKQATGVDAIAADSIAVVDGTPITKAEYDQNRAFQTLLATQQFTDGKLFRSSTPRLISFAAPYTECIRAVKKQVPKNEKVTQRQLRQYCVSVEKQLKDGPTEQLLTAEFLRREAAAEQIEITDAQISRALPAKLKQTIDGRKNLAKFEALTGLGEAFLREQVRTELIGERIQRGLTADLDPVTDAEARKHYAKNKADYRHPRTKRPQPFATVKKRVKRDLTEAREEQALKRWQTSTLRAWTAKTTCRSGYVVEFCGNAS